MMTMFFPSTVQVGLPHLHSSFIAEPASTRRISAISASHRSRYAISMQAPPSKIIWHNVLLPRLRCLRAAPVASAGMERQTLRQASPAIMNAPAGSTGRVTLTGCRGLLDRVQHPMACDRVVERGAEMRSLAIVTGEPRVRLGDVDGRAVQWCEPILRRHGQDLERGSRAVTATDGHLEDLGLAAVSRHL